MTEKTNMRWIQQQENSRDLGEAVEKVIWWKAGEGKLEDKLKMETWLHTDSKISILEVHNMNPPRQQVK